MLDALAEDHGFDFSLHESKSKFKAAIKIDVVGKWRAMVASEAEWLLLLRRLAEKEMRYCQTFINIPSIERRMRDIPSFLQRLHDVWIAFQVHLAPPPPLPPAPPYSATGRPRGLRRPCQEAGLSAG